VHAYTTAAFLVELFFYRDGLRWCDAPSEYGPPKTLYIRWKRWSDMDVFALIMMGLAEQAHDNNIIPLPSHRNCVSMRGEWMQPNSKRTALPQAWG
jgi:transposase